MTVENVQAATQRQQNEQQRSAGALVKAYRNDFATVLPSHVKPEVWVRVAQSALKRGKKQHNGPYELETAAQNNPHAFLAALQEAARLGLEPGTEQYYLTPRKVRGQLEILGIVGYQGHIELMYRAGAISSVICEVVRTHDRFNYQPGRDEIPQHEIDWDSEDRGELRLVYAYARMKDGAYSRVVVLNKAAIERIKQSSQGADSEYSPWAKHPEAMWLKSAVRQLAKWVPTSAEYIREQLRAVKEVAAERTDTATMAAPAEFAPTIDAADEGVIDAELVNESTGEIDQPGAGS